MCMKYLKVNHNLISARQQIFKLSVFLYSHIFFFHSFQVYIDFFFFYYLSALLFAWFLILITIRADCHESSSLFEVAGLLSDSDGHVAASIEIAPLNGDPGTPRNGPLRWLDTGEVRSLERRRKILVMYTV